MDFEYVVRFDSEKLYLPKESHVLNMIGTWLGGNVYIRTPRNTAKLFRETVSIEIYRVRFSVFYSETVQKCSLPLIASCRWDHLRETLKNALLEDFSGKRRARAVITRDIGGQPVQVGIQWA